MKIRKNNSSSVDLSGIPIFTKCYQTMGVKLAFNTRCFDNKKNEQGLSVLIETNSEMMSIG